MQAGFMPPAITVAVRRDRYIGQWLADGLPFVLSLLGSGQTGLLRHFRRGFSPGQSPFVTIEIERTAKGVAALRDALGYLECEPDGYMDSGDHRIFLAKITAGKMATELPPMIHVRRSGMHY
jgi:flavin reductase (DIM6/NTAB) family NADH-FMN oxidoreductase RutF